MQILNKIAIVAFELKTNRNYDKNAKIFNFWRFLGIFFICGKFVMEVIIISKGRTINKMRQPPPLPYHFKLFEVAMAISQIYEVRPIKFHNLCHKDSFEFVSQCWIYSNLSRNIFYTQQWLRESGYFHTMFCQNWVLFTTVLKLICDRFWIQAWILVIMTL